MISLKLKGTCKYKVLVNGQGRNNSETQRFTQGEPQEMDPVSLQTEEQTNIPVALPPSPVTQDQVWHARQAGMCKAVCSSACCLGSFVLELSLFYTDTTAQGQCACSWRRAGQPRAPELCSQEQRVEPEMSLLPGTYSHHDSTTHGLPQQCPQEAVLHVFFWLLSTTWLVLTPQPHYRATLWRGQEISFQLHNFKTDLNGVCN